MTTTRWMRAGGASDNPERIARRLGWLSVGLGLTEIAAPRAVARAIGVRDDERHRNAMLALGIRELISGFGILTQPRSSGWLWARVGGDIVDLALLGSALKSGTSRRGRVAAATAATIGIALLDVRAGRGVGRGSGNGRGRPHERGLTEVSKAITVRAVPEEVYAFWRDFQNLPRFMEHLESVQVISDRRSRWTAKAPGGRNIDWEAEIVEDRPDELIGWRVVGDADVTPSGMVRFTPAPGGRGTEVRVELRLFGENPGQQVESDLRRFKQVMETGEVVRSDASVHRGPHPARPSAELM